MLEVKRRDVGGPFELVKHRTQVRHVVGEAFGPLIDRSQIHHESVLGRWGRLGYDENRRAIFARRRLYPSLL